MVMRFWGNLAPHREAIIRIRALLRLVWAPIICLMAAPPPAAAAELRPEAVQGFDQYVRLTERRMQSELAPGGAFLWVDGLPEPQRSELYARMQGGEVISEKLQTVDPWGRFSPPAALIHHWVGTIFIPGASLA